MVDEARNISVSAMMTFQGVYPTKSPHFFWGEGKSLPWENAYFDKLTSEPISVEKTKIEIAQIAAKLTSQRRPGVEVWGLFDWDYYPGTLTYDLPSLGVDQKLTIQSLSVEAIVACDAILCCVFENRLSAASPRMAAAHKILLEQSTLVWELFTTTSEAGYKAAQARHKENREMKKQVFEWCAKELASFRSMDAAAQEVANKIVPVTFRTARSWISEYKKSIRSAGTL